MRWHARMPLMAQAKQGKSENKQEKKSAKADRAKDAEKSAKVKKTEKVTSTAVKAIAPKTTVTSAPKAEKVAAASKVAKATKTSGPQAGKAVKATKTAQVAAAEPKQPAKTAKTAKAVEQTAVEPAKTAEAAKSAKVVEQTAVEPAKTAKAAKSAKAVEQTAAVEPAQPVKTAKSVKATKAAAKPAPETAKAIKVAAKPAAETAKVTKAAAAKSAPETAKVTKAAAKSVPESAEATKVAAKPAAEAAKATKAAAAKPAAETAPSEPAQPAQPAEPAADAAATAAAEKAVKADARKAKEELKSAKAAARAALKAEDRELEPAQAKKFVEQVAAEIIAADAASARAVLPTSALTELLRLKPGAPVDLTAFDSRATPGVETRAQAEAQLAVLAARVGELQERLYAAAVGGDSKRRVLLVLQGMDTSGKGGTVRHVAGLLDPNGTRIKAFKAPTPEELEHDFLWRIRENAPVAGQIGIFDRSQYEDVLVAKVRKLALPMHIGRRYGSINKFEKSLADDGCVVVKCFLHISPEEQRERLLARLEDPDKHWKYNPGDVDDRLLWPDFQEAYRIALERCGTEAAPWHVIPADRKWYRNYAVLRLLIEALESIDPQYPAGDYDLAAERARVLAS